MKFTYENQGNNSFLVYQIQPEDPVDSVILNMLVNNKIERLALTQYTQKDTERFLKYNITSRLSVSQILSRTVNRQLLCGIFLGIAEALMNVEDYMIVPESLLLDPDYIYTDISTGDTIMIALPFIGKKIEPEDLRNFFRNIVSKLKYSEQENGDYGTRIQTYLNSTPQFQVPGFVNLLKELLSKKEENEKVIPKTRQVNPGRQPLTPQPVNPGRQPLVTTPVNQGRQPLTPPPVDQGRQPLTPPLVNQPATTIPAFDPKKGTQTNTPWQFAIPGQKTELSQTAVSQDAQPEKRMKLSYLLQHYNKENAAIYKAQKKREKEAKNNPMTPQQAYPVPGAPVSQIPTVNPYPIPGQQMQTPNAAVQPGNLQGVSSVPQQPVTNMQQMQRYYPMRQQPGSAGGQANFGDTTVLGGNVNNETTVLSSGMGPNQVKNPHLIRRKNNERILINKNVFLIGKERSAVDYFVSDNPAVSRSHANIIVRNDEYYVMDLNSKNHTFVNGNLIPINEEIRLSHGDRVCLGNEEFEFRVY